MSKSTAIKEEWDDLVRDAGLENIASCMGNIEMMVMQELDALRSCAQQGAGAVIQCPHCGKYVMESFTAKVFLSSEGYRPSIFVMVFDCPYCEEVVETEIIPGENITLPF